MSKPFFLAIYADGGLVLHDGPNFAPVAGNPTFNSNTLLGVFRINSDAKAQKIVTLTGTAGTNLALSNPSVANGRYGVELT